MITSIRDGQVDAAGDSRRRDARRSGATGEVSSRRAAARSTASGLAALLRTMIARLLHTGRRRAARAALHGRVPRSILAVCYGNICRSPMAAALFERALGAAGVEVGSAGFIGPDRPSPPEAVTAAAQHGVDLSSHRSRVLTPDLVRWADLVVVMDGAQQRQMVERFGRSPRDVIVLGDLDPGTVATRAIHDPVDQPLQAFEESYARIERCVEALVDALRHRSGGR